MRRGGGDPSSVNEFDLGAALDSELAPSRNAGPGRHLPGHLTSQSVQGCMSPELSSNQGHQGGTALVPEPQC